MAGPTPESRLSLRTLAINLVVLSAAVLLTLLGLEVSFRLLDLLERERAVMDPDRVAFADAPAETGAPPDFRPVYRLVQHPFQGWETRRALKNYGGYLELEESDFVIGIFGGSVAGMVSNYGKKSLIDSLGERRPGLKGSIRVVNFGRGAYKQPQQAFLLSQMILLGVPFDAVVNIDGYNEVALGMDNADHGHHPLLPHWKRMMLVADISREAPTQTEVEIAARIIALRRKAQQLQGAVERYPRLHHTELVKALLGRVVLQAEAEAVELEMQLEVLAQSADASKTWVTLDDPCLEQDSGCWELIAKVWLNSSRMMASVAQSAGAVYLHVLQPNQYVAGTKRLSPEEVAHAYDPGSSSGRAISVGYPYLQRRAAELKRDGIHFHDLTMLFSTYGDTIFADVCCHYNRRGNQVLAEALGRLIDEALGGDQR